MNTLFPQPRLLRTLLAVLLPIVLTLLSIPVLHAAGNDRAVQRRPADLKKRTALIIGNSSYKDSPLANPVHDARDMAAVLKQLGFDVIVKTNADKRTMKKAINNFARKLQKSQVGLFYYAGHGMQVNGANYLIPVAADVQSESDIEYEAVHAGRVIGKMRREAGNTLNIVILDACRNNPFKRSFRSSRSGLARMDAPIGTIIAYSTSPGSVAADGSGRNGLFTGALLKSFQQPGLTIQEALNRAGMEVMQESHRQQVPWMSSTPVPGFYLAGSGSMETSTPTAQTKTGSLEVETRPGKAEIFIDGYLEGRAPLKLQQIKPGRVTVRAEITGYEAGEKKVRIRAGRNSRLTLILDKTVAAEPEPTTGSLTIYATPADALVRILNIAPHYAAGMELAPSRYHIEVSRAGYLTHKEWLELAAGQELVKEIPLAEVEPIVVPEPVEPAPSVAGPRHGDTWTEPKTGMEFVYIRGGCFQMGSPKSEPGRDDDEKQHKVCVDGFWLGKYEVTNRQYRLFRSSHDSGDYDGNDLNSNDQPVVNVSWQDAAAYAEWLSGKSGKKMVLPSEAQWEYAARAGTGTVRFWGDDADDACSYANVYDRTSKGAFDYWSRQHHDCKDGYAVTAPVGSFRANEFGLYDMLGNVYEWCSDWYGENYYSTSPRQNPRGPSSGSLRVLRGGSWYDYPAYVRSADRSGLEPGDRDGILGFRLAFVEGSR